MPQLPSVTGRELIRALERDGFYVKRISGSHQLMEKPGHRFVVSVPVHASKPIKKGTLKGILSAADLTVDRFKVLLG